MSGRRQAAPPPFDSVFSAHHASYPEIEMTSPATGIKVCLQVDRASFGGGVPFKRVIYRGGRNE